ncbi:hypothetical protein HAP94_08810 [Acidithiobacillus ferrivorans]|nr:hypothetical protein [Acidithiobacillus ferrivorans]
MKILGYSMYAFGIATTFVSGLVGYIMCLILIFKYFGVALAVSALIFFPITLSVVPLYAGFTHGNWIAAILTYVGPIIGTILAVLGGFIGDF